EGGSSRSPHTTSTPCSASILAAFASGLRTSARSFHPCFSMWRMTDPPCRPVAPVTSTMPSRLVIALHSLFPASLKIRQSACGPFDVRIPSLLDSATDSSDDPLEHLQNPGVLGLQVPIYRYILYRVFA